MPYSQYLHHTPEKRSANIKQHRKVVSFLTKQQQATQPRADTTKQEQQQTQEQLLQIQQQLKLIELQQQQVQQQQAQLQLQIKEVKEVQEQQLLESNNGTNSTAMEVEQRVKKSGSRVINGKISRRREKKRRRNIRYSKILQPKNAVVILNELIKHNSYKIEQLPSKFGRNQFKATVICKGSEYEGYGTSKIMAKNAAAEEAFKQHVKSNQRTEFKEDNEDVAEDNTLPWQHLASFALYKLLRSWGEDTNMINACESKQNSSQVIDLTEKQHENKSSKKMPENPETMDPLELIDQMLPHAQFESTGETGSPPDVIYSFKCIVDGQIFYGIGRNKESAKRMAAYKACRQVLAVAYPCEVYIHTHQCVC